MSEAEYARKTISIPFLSPWRGKAHEAVEEVELPPTAADREVSELLHALLAEGAKPIKPIPYDTLKQLSEQPLLKGYIEQRVRSVMTGVPTGPVVSDETYETVEEVKIEQSIDCPKMTLYVNGLEIGRATGINVVPPADLPGIQVLGDPPQGPWDKDGVYHGDVVKPDSDQTISLILNADDSSGPDLVDGDVLDMEVVADQRFGRDGFMLVSPAAGARERALVHDGHSVACAAAMDRSGVSCQCGLTARREEEEARRAEQEEHERQLKFFMTSAVEEHEKAEKWRRLAEEVADPYVPPTAAEALARLADGEHVHVDSLTLHEVSLRLKDRGLRRILCWRRDDFAMMYDLWYTARFRTMRPVLSLGQMVSRLTGLNHSAASPGTPLHYAETGELPAGVSRHEAEADLARMMGWEAE